MPYDWRGFWTTRLDRVQAAVPLEGLTASGWRLEFGPDPSPVERAETRSTRPPTYATHWV